MRESKVREVLRRENRLRIQLFRMHLLAMGLTPGQGQAKILDCLREQEPLSQRELAELCDIDVTNMSRTIERMVEAGYLMREVNPESRRMNCIGLTEKGRKKAEEARALLNMVDELMEGAMTEAEQEQFCAVMERICERLEKACKNQKETGL